MIALEIIVCVDMNGGIGYENKIPWSLRSDMKRFRDITIGDSRNAVIMGRNTWESLPIKYKPLPNRLNVVLSRNEHYTIPNKNVIIASNLDKAIGMISSNIEHIFIIGGAQLYKEALSHKDCNIIHLTYINQQFNCDTYFPINILDKYQFKIISSSEMIIENGIRYKNITLTR